jgi:hypothetical protein
LPEPASGGAQAAVGGGAGNVQTTGGTAQAKAALAFCVSKIGLPYIWGGVGPNGYDCSGLVYEAYLSVGQDITRTTNTQWPTAAGAHVPDGVGNLSPGDLLYFGPSTSGTATEHVAMVHTVDVGANTAYCVQATDPADGIQDMVSYSPISVGANFGTNLTYLGALRPTP